LSEKSETNIASLCDFRRSPFTSPAKCY